MVPVARMRRDAARLRGDSGVAKICRHPGCGRVIPNDARHGRCAKHASGIDAKLNAKRASHNERTGRNRSAVRRAMRAAVKRDARCVVCGTTEKLQAHFLYPEREHSDNPDDYEARCPTCHGKVKHPRQNAST